MAADMDEKLKKKRPWFQFHLSTAVVLMFVAGGLMCANIEGRRGTFYVEAHKDGHEYNKMVAHLYGWPFVLCEYMTEEECREYNGFADWTIPAPIYCIVVLPLNLVCCLTILASVAVLLEWHIRFKSAKAEPPKDGAS